MSKPLEQRQVGELAFVTLLLALAAGVAVEAWRIAGFSGISSPGAFPLGVSTVLLLSGSVILGDALRKPSAAAGGWLSAARQFCAQHFPRCILVFIALAVAYLASIQWASFYPATFVFLLLSVLYLRGGRPLVALLASGVSTGLIWLLFSLAFSVYLP
ncbi:tripartite tricarboxylate transporter TctB family protein [Pseudomonas oryzae]|uniref:Tripartite tricarboxylate transporter TctB family protein n=1 Tax=Pseudomonas oryzae TaxID=1392877 RepID=A0A1H1PVX6_9PSED|nr:tripartite tricarboxylate transporter TctB family protein [Pseudomonas oryzae]SDS14859.1 Tripartite tricarboxylate transporter TctB family protein [Pseudomonas oryzae]